MLKRSASRQSEAKLRYLDADIHVVSAGDFVRCAVTGKAIPLEALRYWSVERQEAYVDAAAALSRMGYGEKRR